MVYTAFGSMNKPYVVDGDADCFAMGTGEPLVIIIIMHACRRIIYFGRAALHLNFENNNFQES